MLILCMDPALGRLDYESLSDQTLLEMLFDGVQKHFKEQFRFVDDHGSYKDFCDMYGFTCDADGRVTSIARHSFAALGTVALEFIPPIVRVFCIGSSEGGYKKLRGKLLTDKLPLVLETLNILNQSLDGTVDLAKLPPKLVICQIANNKFEGSCDLRTLPNKLELLWLYRNRFDGSISLDTLPASLIQLLLSRNQLSGELCFASLHASLHELDISRNSFSGSFVLHVRESGDAVKIIASYNSFEGKAVIPDGLYFHAKLNGNKITEVVTESGAIHPRELYILMSPPK